MIRKILALMMAYLLFALSAVALFQLAGQKPHAPASLRFQILTAIYGAIFSVLAGFVLQLIARTKNLNMNFVLAVIMAGFAVFSMIKSDGSSWTQLMAVFIFAPISILGGYFYMGRHRP